jgi:hypothetical protein
MTKEINPYIDANRIDRTKQIEEAFAPTREDIQNDPAFYAELVNDLMYHWVYGTRETKLMFSAKESLLISYGDLNKQK